MKKGSSQRLEPLVLRAISTLQESQGSRTTDIANYILQEYNIGNRASDITKRVRIALRRACAYGILQREKNGCYTYNFELINPALSYEEQDQCCPKMSKPKNNCPQKKKKPMCKKKRKPKSKPCCPPAPKSKCPKKKKPKCPPPCPVKPKCAGGGERDDTQPSKPTRQRSSSLNKDKVDVDSLNSNSSVEDNLDDDLPNTQEEEECNNNQQQQQQQQQSNNSKEQSQERMQ